jgi:hypothetical protein
MGAERFKTGRIRIQKAVWDDSDLWLTKPLHYHCTKTADSSIFEISILKQICTSSHHAE